MLPADLTRTAGQGLILHTKICGDEKTYVSRYGDQDVVGFANSLPQTLRNMYEYNASEPDSLPKWLPQVRDRLERLALNDADAREALAAIARGEAKEKEGKRVPGSHVGTSAPSAGVEPRQARSYQVDSGDSDPLP